MNVSTLTWSMLNSLLINILVFISGGFADPQRYSYFIIFTSFFHPFSDSRETALCSLLITTFFLFFYFLFHYFLFNFVNPRRYFSSNSSVFLKVNLHDPLL